MLLRLPLDPDLSAPIIAGLSRELREDAIKLIERREMKLGDEEPLLSSDYRVPLKLFEERKEERLMRHIQDKIKGYKCPLRADLLVALDLVEPVMEALGGAAKANE